MPVGPDGTFANFSAKFAGRRGARNFAKFAGSEGGKHVVRPISESSSTRLHTNSLTDARERGQPPTSFNLFAKVVDGMFSAAHPAHLEHPKALDQTSEAAQFRKSFAKFAEEGAKLKKEIYPFSRESPT